MYNVRFPPLFFFFAFLCPGTQVCVAVAMEVSLYQRARRPPIHDTGIHTPGLNTVIGFYYSYIEG